LSFICTYDDKVPDIIQLLKTNQVQGLYTVKSTLPQGSTISLMKKYEVHVCHNPEFLRQDHALEDVLNPDRIIIGKCCDVHAELLKKLYAPLKKPMLIVDPTESELIKLTSNAYLCTIITFWNEVFALTRKNGVDIKAVAKGVTLDSRISEYGTMKFGKAFNGKCLPKDLNHLLDAFHEVGLNTSMFESVRKVNEELTN
jgi:UDPglucose 6-dehydrogenase